MDIIRYYWISWDNSDGTEGEEIARTAKQAETIYQQMKTLNVPYVKLVACYDHQDLTIKSYKREG